jgi:hypothetical protein
LDALHRETIQRLFVIATLLASEAEEISVAGQSHKVRPGMLHRLTLRLRRKAVELKSVADSILTVTALADRES